MIRHFTLGDYTLYRRIRLEALASDPGAFGETRQVVEERSDSELIEWLSQRIVPGKKTIAYVEQEGRPVAMCGFGISDEDATPGFFWGLYVSPKFRRRRHGQLLLAEAESWVRARGGRAIKARVATPNDSAITFYRIWGYSAGDRWERCARAHRFLFTKSRTNFRRDHWLGSHVSPRPD